MRKSIKFLSPGLVSASRVSAVAEAEAEAIPASRVVVLNVKGINFKKHITNLLLTY